MNHSDIAALMKGAAPVIRDYVAGAVQPLLLQIDTMQKEIAALKAKHVDPDDLDSRLKAFTGLLKEDRETAQAESKERQIAIDDLKAVVVAECETMVTEKLAALPVPKDGEAGKSITVDDVAPMIKAEVERIASGLPDIGEMVREAVDKIPEGIDGKDADPELIKQMVTDAVAALPPAEKGNDADPVEVAAQIAEEVQRVVAALPAPENGKSVTVDELRPTVDEAVAKAVAALPVAKDGIDAVDVMIDREGSLVFTMSDGRMKNVGQVVGRDGVDVDMTAVAKAITEQVAAIPKPKDGIDGVGFDDLDLAVEDEGVMIKFAKGENVKQFRLPVPIDRGVFREGTRYLKGNSVSFGGSVFIAQEDTDEKPETGKAWRLAVKRGRDGKDAGATPTKKPGPVKVS